MVTNGSDGSGGSRRLPDEAFAPHARRPDPSRDDHVAFPDEGLPAGTARPSPSHRLPPSAWAPAHGEAAHGQRDPFAPGVTLHRGRPWPFTLLHPSSRPLRSRRRRSLVAVLLLGGVLYAGVLDEVMGGGDDRTGGYGFEIHSSGADGPAIIHDVVEVPFEREAVILPGDQTTSPLPASPRDVRVEVVGDEPEASVTITSGTDTLLAGALLPYAVEFALLQVPDRLSVSVRSGSGDKHIQCRVYADGFLVAIGTGTGSADCVARRVP